LASDPRMSSQCSTSFRNPPSWVARCQSVHTPQSLTWHRVPSTHFHVISRAMRTIQGIGSWWIMDGLEDPESERPRQSPYPSIIISSRTAKTRYNKSVGINVYGALHDWRVATITVHGLWYNCINVYVCMVAAFGTASMTLTLTGIYTVLTVTSSLHNFYV